MTEEKGFVTTAVDQPPDREAEGGAAGGHHRVWDEEQVRHQELPRTACLQGKRFVTVAIRQ